MENKNGENAISINYKENKVMSRAGMCLDLLFLAVELFQYIYLIFVCTKRWRLVFSSDIPLVTYDNWRDCMEVSQFCWIGYTLVLFMIILFLQNVVKININCIYRLSYIEIPILFVLSVLNGVSYTNGLVMEKPVACFGGLGFFTVLFSIEKYIIVSWSIAEYIMKFLKIIICLSFVASVTPWLKSIIFDYDRYNTNAKNPTLRFAEVTWIGFYVILFVFGISCDGKTPFYDSLKYTIIVLSLLEVICLLRSKNFRGYHNNETNNYIYSFLSERKRKIKEFFSKENLVPIIYTIVELVVICIQLVTGKTQITFDVFSRVFSSNIVQTAQTTETEMLEKFAMLLNTAISVTISSMISLWVYRLTDKVLKKEQADTNIIEAVNTFNTFLSTFIIQTFITDRVIVRIEEMLAEDIFTVAVSFWDGMADFYMKYLSFIPTQSKLEELCVGIVLILGIILTVKFIKKSVVIFARFFTSAVAFAMTYGINIIIVSSFLANKSEMTVPTALVVLLLDYIICKVTAWVDKDAYDMSIRIREHFDGA